MFNHKIPTRTYQKASWVTMNFMCNPKSSAFDHDLLLKPIPPWFLGSTLGTPQLVPSDIASCSVARFPRHGAAGPSRTGRRFESWCDSWEDHGCYGNSSINIPKCFFFGWWQLLDISSTDLCFFFFLRGEIQQRTVKKEHRILWKHVCSQASNGQKVWFEPRHVFFVYSNLTKK